MADNTHTDTCTHTNSAPVLHECPACLFMSDKPSFADNANPCPNCGAKGAVRQALPAHRIRRFDERIRGYHREGEHEIVVILVSTFLESVLEDILARMMAARGADKNVTALVLDTERSVGLRIGKLFPALSGESFETVAAHLGYADFPLRWKHMRNERNAFIHGESFDSPRETLDAEMACDAMELLDQAYKLFELINNRFVADAQTGRS